MVKRSDEDHVALVEDAYKKLIEKIRDAAEDGLKVHCSIPFFVYAYCGSMKQSGKLTLMREYQTEIEFKTGDAIAIAADK